MSEEQIEKLEKEMEAAGLEEESFSRPETITVKDPTVLPVVKQVGKRFQRVNPAESQKLKSANSRLQKIATSLGKERAKLQEIYKIKKQYYLSDDSNNISREIAGKLFSLLQSGDLDREKLSYAAQLLIRLDQTQKLLNTLDLEIESRRVAIEKLKAQMTENGVKKGDTFTFSVRTKISRLKERFAFSRVAKNLKKETAFRIKANINDDKINDSQLKNAFLRGESLGEAIQSISDKSFDELQSDLTSKTSEYNAVIEETDAYLHENHHYTEELLQRKRQAWDAYANAFWLTIIKAQEIERQSHYEQLRQVFSKYGVEKKEDGTIICKVGDELFEVRKNSLLADAERVLEASKGVKDEVNEEKPDEIKEEPVESNLIDELNDEQTLSEAPTEPLPKEELEESEVVETKEEPEETKEEVKEEPTLEETKEETEEEIEKTGLNEEMLEPVSNEEISTDEKLNQVENEYRKTAAESKHDLLVEKMKLIDEKRKEIEKEIADSKEKNNQIIEIRREQLEELHGTPKSIADTFEQGIDYDKEMLVPVTIKDENGKEDILYPVTRAELANLETERLNLLKEYRDLEAEKREQLVSTTREKVSDMKNEKLLNEARNFFKYVDTSTTTGYDVSGLSDEEIINLYNDISKDKSNSVYVNAMAKMEAENKAEIPEKTVEEKQENVTPIEGFYNEQEELEHEIDSQINEQVADTSGLDVFVSEGDYSLDNTENIEVSKGRSR